MRMWNQPIWVRSFTAWPPHLLSRLLEDIHSEIDKGI